MLFWLGSVLPLPVLVRLLRRDVAEAGGFWTLRYAAAFVCLTVVQRGLEIKEKNEEWGCDVDRSGSQ